MKGKVATLIYLLLNVPKRITWNRTKKKHIRRLSPPPVRLKTDESITQTRASERQSQSELSSFIARPRSLDWGFVPADVTTTKSDS
eukprot:superscaffoldBa00002185_g13476